MHVSYLAIHPLKSAAAVPVQALPIGALGPEWDRRWMLVDSEGAFVTQRTHPRLCLVSARVEAGRLHLGAPGMPPLEVVPVAAPPVAPARVWRDTVSTELPSPEADAWCSAFLGLPVRLAFLPGSTRRPVDPAWAGEGHRTAFSDGFPLLVTTQSSLDHLNGLLVAEGLPAVDWRRFRPNLVVAGDVAPHAEDGWRRLRVGEVELALVKPCSRCAIPSIDPDTARKDPRILQVLRRYRAREDGFLYLGQNAVVVAASANPRISLQDRVEVLV